MHQLTSRLKRKNTKNTEGGVQAPFLMHSGVVSSNVAREDKHGTRLSLTRTPIMNSKRLTHRAHYSLFHFWTGGKLTQQGDHRCHPSQRCVSCADRQKQFLRRSHFCWRSTTHPATFLETSTGTTMFAQQLTSDAFINWTHHIHEHLDTQQDLFTFLDDFGLIKHGLIFPSRVLFLGGLLPPTCQPHMPQQTTPQTQFVIVPNRLH